MRSFLSARRALVAACVGLVPGLALAGPPAAPVRPDPAGKLPAKAAPAAPTKTAPGRMAGRPPVTLTAVGDQLVITGDDPAAVARAYELARLILVDKGQEYRAFHLQYANATDVARVLDEWFNGPPKKTTGLALSPLLAALAQRGRGGRNAPPPPPPEPPRVRVVAVPETNSLLVRGTALDLVAVQRVIESAIDVEPGDSAAAMKPFVIGPLRYAVATEVVRVLKDVYQQDLDQGTVPGARRATRRGRQPQQPLDPSGRPKPVTLTIAADDRTNSVLGMAPGPMAADIRKVVGVLEEKARVDTKSVELVPANGIDPNLLRDVLDAIQAKPPAATAPPRAGGSTAPPRR
jgi:hypothetical protein